MKARAITAIDLLVVLSRRKGLLAGIVVAVAGTGMVLTMMQAPTYRSEIRILISRDRVDPRVSPDNSTESYRPEFTDEEFNSELEILRSRAVIEGVVTSLAPGNGGAGKPGGILARTRAAISGLYRHLHRQQAPDRREEMVAAIADRLEIYSVKKSRIIRAVYEDESPEQAARVLDALYHRYTDHHLELLKNYKAAGVFREQSEIFRERLQTISSRLKDFDQRFGIAANTGQKDLLLRQFYDAKSQHERSLTEILETEQRIASLRQQLAAQPERVESEVHTRYVAARDKIKDEIVTLDLQRTEMLRKFQPGHRSVKDVEARLTQARELLVREESAPPRETTVVLNEMHRRLTSELLAAQTLLSTLRERERMLGQLSGRYRGAVGELDRKSIERLEIERDHAASEEAYLLYRRKAQEAEIASALNRERILNITLTDPPTIDHRPVSPKPLVNLVLLLLVGMALSVSVVAFLERRQLMMRRYSHPFLSHDTRLAGLIGSGTAQLEGGTAVRGLLPLPVGAGEAEVAESPGGGAGPDPGGGEIESPVVVDDSRLASTVEYLHRVYGLLPREIALFLKEISGWQLRPEEIERLLTERRLVADGQKQRETSAGGGVL